MTAVCECGSEYLISINTRNSLTICVTASIEEIIAHHVQFYSFFVTKFYESFPLSASSFIIL
jgi:hypothetical protein